MPNALLGSGDAKVEQNRIPNLKSLITESESTHKNESKITAITGIRKMFRSHE